jgi:hypothetical protein
MNDVFVDGAYVYGSGGGGGGGGIADAPNDNFMYGRVNGAWAKTVMLSAFEQLARAVRWAVNLFDRTDILENTYISVNDGGLQSSMDYTASGIIPVVPGASYAIEGVSLRDNGRIRMVGYDSSGNAVKFAVPNGVSFIVPASGFEVPANAVSMRFQVRDSGFPGFVNLESVLMYRI